jgi:hypothetical protein
MMIAVQINLALWGMIACVVARSVELSQLY